MRKVEDTMGEVFIPDDALWGAQTQRAVYNFPLSGIRFGREFIRALGLVKMSAAAANHELGLLDSKTAGAIQSAAEEVIEGKWDEHFPVDVFQSGSGTSTNMNVNEVIATRANQILGGDPGSRDPVHPNDHVNLSQSSNDVFPTAIHLAAYHSLKKEMLPALNKLKNTLEDKEKEFDQVLKTGRTHLRDALPVQMGQVFRGYAGMVEKSIRRLEKGLDILSVLPLGGTAVGTGANRPESFPDLAALYLNQFLEEKFSITPNHMEANSSRDDLVEVSGLVKTTAVGISKIAHDLRWMSSGPRAGLNELNLPRVQPGSSIMPGKDNPVICEAVIMVAAQVIGNDAAITQGGLGGRFELNTMMPLIAHSLINSIAWLARAVDVFSDHCAAGIGVNQDHCRELVNGNLTLVTALVPVVGYDRAAEISREAFQSGRTIREVAREEGLLPEEELDRLLDPRRLTEPDPDPDSE